METTSHWARRRGAVFGVLGLLACIGAVRAADNAATHTVGEPARPYQVLLPPGETKGQALVVFLHGSGKANLDRFQADYRPLFWKRRCVVAIPTTDNKLKWRYGDAKYILAVIADVEKRYGTDPKRVVLMGVSGGGQTVLFLVDHAPERFRAVIAVSTNPVVIRGRHHEWFYPSKTTAKRCPYFILNHITQGTSLQYWRQVRARREGTGASLSIVPVLGKVSHYLPPPKALDSWLDEVLAGKHPAPIPDPQKAAVAKMLAPAASALPKAVQAARPAATTQPAAKDGEVYRLAVPVPAKFRRAGKEEKSDAASRPITQVRLEHAEWPISVRCDARRTELPLGDVLAAEDKKTRLRGLLYQVYHTVAVRAGGRAWPTKIGSITYPDRKRGWVSALFLHAASPIEKDPKQWIEVLVIDETQQPDAAELAGIFRTVVNGIQAGPAPSGAKKPAK